MTSTAITYICLDHGDACDDDLDLSHSYAPVKYRVTWRNAINGKYCYATYDTLADAERWAVEHRPYNNTDATIRTVPAA